MLNVTLLLWLVGISLDRLALLNEGYLISSTQYGVHFDSRERKLHEDFRQILLE